MEKEKIKLKILDSLIADGIPMFGPKQMSDIINRFLPKGERTIGEESASKYIEELRKLVRRDGVGIEQPIKGKQGYRYTNPDYRYYKDVVSEDEKNLLLVANNLFNIFSGSGLSTNFSFVVNKILKKNSRTGEVKDIENFSPIILGPSQKDPGLKWLPILIKAMRHNVRVELDYIKDDGTKSKRVLSPYIVKQYANNWYLVAYDHYTTQAKKTKIYRLAGIKSMIITSLEATRDPDFSAEDYFKYSIGIFQSHINKPLKIKIQVIDKDKFNEWNTSPLHQTQVILNKSNRVIQIETFKTDELFSLLLQHSPFIKVMSPKPLIAELKKILTCSIKHYI